MLQPKKTKERKYFKPRIFSKFLAKTQKSINCFAQKPVQSGYMNGQQLGAARQNIGRQIKQEGKLEIPILTDIPIKRKPTAARHTLDHQLT